MKKNITVLLILALVFGFAVCGCGAAPANTANTPADETPAETEAPAATEAPEAEKKAIPDEDAQISLIFSLLNSFRQDEKTDKWSYTVTDLDHNGRLEVIAASIQGQGRYTNAKVWEISSDKKTLGVCRIPLEEGDSFPDIVTNTADTFHDKKSDEWFYLFNDHVTVSSNELYSSKCSLSLDDGVVNSVIYAFQSTQIQNGQMNVSFTDKDGVPITPDEYESAGANVYAGLERSSTNFDWFGISEAKTASRFADSYAVFIGDKQPAKPDSAPEANPDPSAQGYVMVTKHPTSEYHYAGETALFIAGADNWNSASWTFVSPNGGEYTWQNFSSIFPYASVVGGSASSLSIANVGSDMNGWGAYCTFCGSNGRTVRTNTAYLYISDQPTPPPPTPTPTPPPTYNQMDGSVSDYAMSTVSIRLNNGMEVSVLQEDCDIAGSIYVGAPATVYYTGDTPDIHSIYHASITGTVIPPEPTGGTMSGTVASGGNETIMLSLSDGETVSVSRDVCSVVGGSIGIGDSATVYYNGYGPSSDTIYHVDIYGSHATGLIVPDDDEPEQTHATGLIVPDEDDDDESEETHATGLIVPD